MSKRKRFVILDDNDLDKKSKQCKNINTEKSDMRAHRAFTKFLEAYGKTGEDLEYWNYTESELDNFLSKFWFGARKDTSDENDENEDEDPENKKGLYTANSLRNFRYALNRVLKNKGTVFDLLAKDSISFRKSSTAFENAVKELKKEGKADVKSKREINENSTI